MKFFETILKNIYSPKYYRGLLEKPFWHSLKYFYILILAVALVITLFFSVTAVPKITSILKDVSGSIVLQYPEELEVTITDGVAFTNVEEPYFISRSILGDRTTGEVFGKKNKVENVVVIDTQTPFSIDQFETYNTLILVKRDSVAIKNQMQGEITIRSLKEFSGITINKENVALWSEGAVKWYPLVWILLILGIFVYFFTILNIILPYLLLGALVIWGIAVLKSVKIGYVKAYQIGLHAITFAVIIDTLLLNTLIGIDTMWIFSLLTFLVVAVNVGAETSEIVEKKEG